ncbi:NADH-quinone oxidoreductase subunit L [Magnetospira sp. QH-2]|uniref:NADH-quinone oxidoreductase subunit L n=1 Tax=Magnetospira sp. (strain QH-2) TaxID=1288970 RepID=UPI0003E80B29|nr:NADH-quinone oxidoreductase subunit L [Magnetospira sp. QH-2]CCQ73866.1 NADH-quinone oxidoreductase chain L (NADH dehydrogenase I, chain L) (NDH-1, chain L) [Magnetospira sp. QH-2]
MYAAIVFLPFLAFLIAGILAFVTPKDKEHKHRIDRNAQWVTSGSLVISWILSIFAFIDVALGGNPVTIELFRWIQSGSMDVSWALKVDTLTAVMLIVVTTVSAMVHIYSIGYMHHDPDVPRFMAYLSFFTFCMLMLVTADNLLQMFFGWEGVGVASYLLIGFWYDKPSANAAAIKAFLVNRVGDFGFALGIFGTFLLFDTISLDAIFAAVPGKADTMLEVFGMEVHALTALCLLLFVGAMGKSAQLGLHTWLPDAMEGPTPVSALIHAATMVTAGVFMVARLSPMFEFSETALMVVTYVGAFTAFFAATVGLVQNDIKRVIAYSTCSQLGYMFFACGVSAYSAGIFHLMTHASFKALLFLGAGSVIHAMSDEQDMRRMGGIWKMVPMTYILMWIGSLALAGVPPFAGFFSKDMILESAWGAHSSVGNLAFWLGVAAAFMTAFYSMRLLMMTFHGKPRADETTMAHVHESPKVMILPLLVLAAGAIGAGYMGYEYFVGHDAAAFWGNAIYVAEHHQALENAHHAPGWVKLLPLVMGVSGLGLGFLFYGPMSSMPGWLVTNFRSVYDLLLNKWWFDELYDFLFVRPAFKLGRGFWKGGDGAVIDGCGPDGIASGVLRWVRRATSMQTGFVYHYAFSMLIGVAGLVTWYLFTLG